MCNTVDRALPERCTENSIQVARFPIRYEWYEAGKWDSSHGMMPMAIDSIPDEARKSYLRGYRMNRLGLKSNPYKDAYRPDSSFFVRVT